MKQDPVKTTSFRTYLQQDLVRRCQANPSYSLRAYARSMGISSSALSAILNGKRPLTDKNTVRLATALGLSSQIIRSFKEAKSLKATARDPVQQLTLDTFAIVSDWYHFAILELIKVKSFRPDPAWVARSLGLTKSEVNISIERLQRVNLLIINEDGNWIDNSTDGKLTAINDHLTDASAKQFQRQVLENAISALSEVPIEFRSNTTMTFALHPKDLPEAKKRIHSFRRELAEMCERNSQPEHVYNLVISLYPLTQTKELN